MSEEAKFRREMVNFRNSKRCGNCHYFKEPMHCRLLAAAVKSDKVCDKHTKAAFVPVPAKETA
jgi:hypothetical protein